MITVEQKILQFCLIQLQILKDKEFKIRKELQECRLQREFLNSIVDDIKEFHD